MSTFIKFPSFDNSYQKKVIDFFLSIFPDLQNCDYAIESKIDGCNLAIICKPNAEVRYASRNQMIGDIASFHGLNTVVAEYSAEIESMVQYAKDTNKIAHFYCELFGKGIQGRVNYGDKKYIRIISLRVGDEIKSPTFLYNMLEEYNLDHICVPRLGVAKGLQEALDWNEVYVNKIYPEGNSPEEGIIIKPLNRVYMTNNGDIFLLKKKNPKFNERTTKNKKENVISDECSALIDTFCEYINESRMYSVFSKEGKSITSNSEIGFFVKKILEDARTDFIKDSGEYNVECEKKMFSSASKIVASLLINKMNQG